MMPVTNNSPYLYLTCNSSINLIKSNTMKFLKKLFGTAQNTENTTPESKADFADEVLKDIQRDLFVEDTPPYGNAQIDQVELPELERFMKRDFQTQGHSDGYRYHTKDVMEDGKEQIRAEFLDIIHKATGALEEEVLEVHIHIANAEDIDKGLANGLRQQLGKLENDLAKYHSELELAEENKGWIRLAIADYKTGYSKGYHDYLKTRGILGSLAD